MLPRAPDRPFIGRTDEVDRLLGLYRACTEGEPGVALICGDRGLGKTRLADEVMQRAAGLGAQLLRGACTPAGDAGPPGWPFVQALRAVDALPGDGTHLFEQVRAALEQLSSRQPVVLLVDDLHWADDATCKLLMFLVASLQRERLLILVTSRSDETECASGLRSLLSELRRGRRAQFVELAPFVRHEIAALAGLPGDRADPVIDAVWRRSGGNVYLAESLLDAARDGTGGVPSELRDVLVSRFQDLPESAREVARAVAVGGDVVDHWLLAALDVAPVAELSAALRTCVDRQVLMVEPGRDGYRFKDPLLEELVYDELLPGERTRLHAAYGQMLDAHADRLDRDTTAKLAHHWYGAGALAQAQEAALQAAGEAEQRRDFAAALRQYERAIEIEDLLPRGGEGADDSRASMLERAAEVAHLAGEHRRASHLIAQVTAAPTASPEGTAVFLHPRLVRYLCASGASREALAAAEEAARVAVTEIQQSERIHLGAARAEALMLAGRYEESRHEAEVALAAAREAADPSAQAQLLSTLGFDVAMLGDAEAAVAAALEEARELADRSGDPDDIARSYLNLAELLSGPLSRMIDAVHVADAGVVRAAELGLSRSYGVALQAVGINTRFRLGWWNETDALLHEALAINPTGAAAIDLRLARAKLFVGRGDFTAALDELDIIETLTVDAVGPRYRVPLLTLRAGLALWQHRPDYARMAVAEALDDPTVEHDVWLLAPLLWHGLRAEADHLAQAWAHRSADQMGETRQRAATLLARAEALRDDAGRAAPSVQQAIQAYALLCAGEFSRIDGEGSVEVWVDAGAAFDELGQPYPVAYTRWREAEARLNNRTRSSAASAALQVAYEVAVRLGAAPFQQEIEELATRARIDLVAPAVAGPPALIDLTAAAVPAEHEALRDLTARERDVLQLVAEGRSNRDIGDKLYISQKTVSVHVSHILAKLGVRTRVQATALVHQLETAPTR